MEEKRDYAKECGIRCRQIRMSKGMSQQALADLVNVTAQAISKWEKEGISNIDHIMKLSSALGQDITADQFDQDGVLTEVGKEILRIIIEAKGYVDFSDIESNMFGMKSDRIGNELFKLERIGGVVREQFKDFAGEDRDGIFITAKGVIIYKNTVMFPNAEQLAAVITLDERLEDRFSSFQDLIDSDRVTKFMMETNRINSKGFRVDYLAYLYKCHFDTVVKHAYEHSMLFNKASIDKIACGKSCYIDLLRRMAQEISRKEFEDAIEEYFRDLDNFEDYFPIIDELEYQAAGLDEYNMDALRYFCDNIENMPDYYSIYFDEEDWILNSDKSSMCETLRDLVKAADYSSRIDEEGESVAFGEFVQRIRENEEAFFGNLDDSQKKNSNLWFTEEEVRKYVDENILSPKTEEEKKLDEMLRKLWKTDPQILNYYYSFPKAWEDNGLAQYIRDKVGVPDMSMHDETPLE